MSTTCLTRQILFVIELIYFSRLSHFFPPQRQNSNRIKGFNLKGQCSALYNFRALLFHIIMFIRVKTSPNSRGKSVQIVQSIRKGERVSQKIVRHAGMAYDDDELEKLKLLAESIRIKL